MTPGHSFLAGIHGYLTIRPSKRAAHSPAILATVELTHVRACFGPSEELPGEATPASTGREAPRMLEECACRRVLLSLARAPLIAGVGL